MTNNSIKLVRQIKWIWTFYLKQTRRHLSLANQLVVAAQSSAVCGRFHLEEDESDDTIIHNKIIYNKTSNGREGRYLFYG
jgi:hypothetical protein